MLETHAEQKATAGLGADYDIWGRFPKLRVPLWVSL